METTNPAAVIPGRANGSARSAARWQAPREPGIHTPDGGYGFRARGFASPGM